MKLECYMIVKNEEAMLGKALKSLNQKGIDRITILDTGSTDHTPDVVANVRETIAPEVQYIYGVYKWEDDFSKARNTAMSFADAEWLLVLDADERLEGDVSTVINEALDKNPGCDGYEIPTLAVNGNTKHMSIRLHRNKPEEIYWERPAHNALKIDKNKIGVTNIVKVKYDYSPAHEQDLDRTFRILSGYCKEHPDAVRERFYLAREYMYKKEYREALKHYSMYQKRSGFPAELADSYIKCGKCHKALGQMNQAWQCAFRALQINANLKEAYYLLGSLAGPNNSKTWKKMGTHADNAKALFAYTPEKEVIPEDIFRKVCKILKDISEHDYAIDPLNTDIKEMYGIYTELKKSKGE